MDDIQRKFSERFRSHWIKVKFFKKNPNLKNVKKLHDVRFCEATKQALLHPVLLDEGSISCPGAQFAFGWLDMNEFSIQCQNKHQISRENMASILSGIPHFKNPYEYIGLNVEGDPDLLMSFITPETAMVLSKIYHEHFKKSLDIRLSGVAAICSGIAARTVLENMPSFSFCCEDSRKYAQIDSNRLAVGIPAQLFEIFVS